MVKRLSNPQVFVSPTAPSAPKSNDVWIDSDEEFVAGGEGGFVAQPDAPADTTVLWYDTDDNTGVSVSGNADTVDGIHVSLTPTAGSLLPLDVNGKIPASAVDFSAFTYIRATKGATQTLANSGAAVLTFPTEVNDVLGEYDSSTSTFTALSSGLYQISASVRWTTTFVGTNLITIQKNGSNIKESNLNNVYNFETYEVNDTVLLSSGDTLRVYWYNSSSASRTIDSNSASQVLTIARI